MLDLSLGENRYEALRRFDWKTNATLTLAPIPAGSRVRVAVRGAWYTDKHGRPLQVGTGNTSAFMANMLNEAWRVWIRPKVDRMEKAGQELPVRINRILIRSNGTRTYIDFNPERRGRSTGFMEIRPGIRLNAGDPVLLRDIVDFGSVNPPTLGGKPCAWVDLYFRANQISVMFDLRCSDPKKRVSKWSGSDKNWYGFEIGRSLMATNYGHLELLAPKLRALDVPFSTGVPMDKMVALCDEADKESRRHVMDDLIEDTFTARDWSRRLDSWISIDAWKKRLPAFRDALRAYRAEAYGGAVTQLMAQVEGVLMDYLIPRKLGLRTDGSQKKWSTRITELSKELQKVDFGPARLTMAAAVLAFIEESSLYQEFRWNTNAPAMSRHAALHGQDVTYMTKANADRLFLLHDALYWVLGNQGSLNRPSTRRAPHKSYRPSPGV